MILAGLGLLLVALVGFWLLGGVLLRLGGLLLAAAGAFALAVSGDRNGILVVALGAFLWLAGHRHYALRHHSYKSPLAGYVFLSWAPSWLDPSHNWAIPVADHDTANSKGGPDEDDQRSYFVQRFSPRWRGPPIQFCEEVMSPFEQVGNSPAKIFREIATPARLGAGDVDLAAGQHRLHPRSAVGLT
jgi:hypothetical protein